MHTVYANALFIASTKWRNAKMSTYGYIQLPRSLIQDPIWKSFSSEYKCIFFTIVFNVAFQEMELDDFGVKTRIKPGQLLMTERQLVNEAFPHTDDKKELEKYRGSVRRALAKFEKLGFSSHKTSHKKTLHTILRKDILELIVPNFVPNSSQTRPLKQKDKKDKKDMIDQPRAGSGDKVIVLSDLEKKEEVVESTNLHFKTKKPGVACLTISRDLFFNKLYEQTCTKEEIEEVLREYSEKQRNINEPIAYFSAVILNKREQKTKGIKYANHSKSRPIEAEYPTEPECRAGNRSS